MGALDDQSATVARLTSTKIHPRASAFGVVPMQITTFLQTASFGLSEGSIYERLRRHQDVAFDPDLAHAALIYDPEGALVLERVHREYLDVGQRYGLAMFALTDTWRANQERIGRSRF